MPVLSNSRHELFAQAIAKGSTADEAYKLAGYKPSRANASTLRSKQNIADRIDEIKTKAAARVEVSIASVTENLMRIAQKAEALSEASGLSVARASHMDVAKLNGLVTDKKELSGPNGGSIPMAIDARKLSDAALKEIADLDPDAG